MRALFGIIASAAVAGCGLARVSGPELPEDTLAVLVARVPARCVAAEPCPDVTVEAVEGSRFGIRLPEAEDGDRLFVLAYRHGLRAFGLEPGPLASRTLLPRQSLPFQSGFAQRLPKEDWQVLSALPTELSGFKIPPLAAATCLGIGGCFNVPNNADPNLECRLPCVPESELSLPIDPPALPTPLAEPQLGPCAPRWSEVLVAGVAVCAPPSLPTRVTCAEGVQRPGAADCSPLGDVCPSGRWPSDDPPNAIYVANDAGAGMGTREDPMALAEALAIAQAGSTIVLAKGDYTGRVALSPGVSLRGACAEATRVMGVGASTLSVSSGSSVREVQLIGGSPGLVLEDGAAVESVIVRDASVEVFGHVTARGLFVDSAPGTSILIHQGASLVATDVIVEAPTGDAIELRGGALALQGVAVRDLLPGGGGVLSTDADVALEEAYFEGAPALAVSITRGTVQLRDVFVQGAPPGGGGVRLQSTVGDLRRVAIESVDGSAIRVAVTSSVTIDGAWVRGARGVTAIEGGHGVLVLGSSTVQLRRSVFQEVEGSAVAVLGDDRVQVENLVAREVGNGGLVSQRGTMLLSDIVVQNAMRAVAACWWNESPRSCPLPAPNPLPAGSPAGLLRISDLRAETLSSAGLWSTGAVEVAITRASFQGVVGEAVHLEGFEDLRRPVVINDIEIQDSVKGLVLSRMDVTLARAIVRVSEVGVLATQSSIGAADLSVTARGRAVDLYATDLELMRLSALGAGVRFGIASRGHIRSAEIASSPGPGITIEDLATGDDNVGLEDILIRQAGGAGVLAKRSVVSLNRVAIFETQEADVAVLGATRRFGAGLIVTISSVTMKSFDVSENATHGIVVGPNGGLLLQDGVISDQPVGLSSDIDLEGRDVLGNVLFRGNGVDWAGEGVLR